MQKVFANGKSHVVEDGDWDTFCAKFQQIDAAGGLVFNSQGEMLLIYRRGFWDLPKGKRDFNEQIEDTALREVEEECGIGSLKLIRPLIITYHSYNMFGHPILKTTHWYEMKYEGNDPLIPQLEEGIEQAVWVSESNLPRYLARSYSTIQDVISFYLKSR